MYMEGACGWLGSRWVSDYIIRTVNCLELYDFKLWNDPDTLEIYLYSSSYHPEDGHMTD